LGLWEQLNNEDFKVLEFETLRNEAGSNAFTLSPKKWLRVPMPLELSQKVEDMGGTYAHKDIAFEFAIG